MNNLDLLALLGILLFLVAGYFISKNIATKKCKLNEYVRISIRALSYALFFGIGIAGTDADPGFAIPVPNIIAILLMLSEGYYEGVLTGLIILLFWWTIIFSIMAIKLFLRTRRQRKHGDSSISI